MTFRSGRQFLQTPGPTPVPERVLNAMHRQPLDLSDPELNDITATCFADLKAVFGTTGEMFIYAANGHGGWEAALANLFAPGDTVLMPETGHFSLSWAEHARNLGLTVETIAGDGRHAIDADAVEARLRADTAGRIAGLLVVHTDTAAGITNDLAALRGALDAAGHPALFVVDAVASLGAAPFAMDAMRIDAAISASQKGLMGPPGLAFVAANPRAMEAARRNPRERRYWDFAYRAEAEGYRKFCGTAPEYNLFALRAGLDLIAAEGLEAVIARHARLAGAVQAAVEAWSAAGALSFNAVVPAERSASVTTILVPPAMRSETIREYARERCSVALGGGLGPLAGKAFRIGHLGDTNEPMILGCLGAVEMALCELGVPHESGLRAAVTHLARAREAATVVPLMAAR